VNTLAVYPLTPDRWPHLETLFGPDGAYRGCWCMWWRVPAKTYEQNAGSGNRDALKWLVETGRPPGLLAYDADNIPVGWCSLGPRAEYGRFPTMTSPLFKPVDEQPVWSIVCFFIAPGRRAQGIATHLVQAAIPYAAGQGAQILEAYPRDVRTHLRNTNQIYTGTTTLFQKAGFHEVARRHPERPIMRLELP
jgi:GNAT superfamily N-acetyltransferase